MTISANFSERLREQLSKTRTQNNLLLTFSKKCQAILLYQNLSEKSKGLNYGGLSNLFETLSLNENAQAGLLYSMIAQKNQCRVDLDTGLQLTHKCLEYCILVAERQESESILRLKTCSVQAKEEGFFEAAKHFELSEKIQRCHQTILMQLAEKIQKSQKDQLFVKFSCGNCMKAGVLEQTKSMCPLCKYPHGIFIIQLVSESEE